jgi:hypothetical protein
MVRADRRNVIGQVADARNDLKPGLPLPGRVRDHVPLDRGRGASSARGDHGLRAHPGPERDPDSRAPRGGAQAVGRIGRRRDLWERGASERCEQRDASEQGVRSRAAGS